MVVGQGHHIIPRVVDPKHLKNRGTFRKYRNSIDDQAFLKAAPPTGKISPGKGATGLQTVTTEPELPNADINNSFMNDSNKV